MSSDLNHHRRTPDGGLCSHELFLNNQSRKIKTPKKTITVLPLVLIQYETLSLFREN